MASKGYSKVASCFSQKSIDATIVFLTPPAEAM